MDRRERFADTEEALRMAFRGERAGLWTALPGIIESYDAEKMTAVIQPALKGVVAKTDGSAEAVNLPLLPDVPVVFPSGGGCTLTFPVQQGDEVLVIFSSRCIDGWWQSGGIQLPMEPRMHDLSDGFAIFGPKSQPRKLGNLSNSAVQLRSDDGAAFVQINPTTHAIDLATSGTVTVQASGDVASSAGDTNTVSGSYVMLGQGSVGNLAELPGDAGALFDSYMVGGTATENPVSGDLTALSDAISDPQITADLNLLVLQFKITEDQKTAILGSLGGLAGASVELGTHTDYLAGVTSTTDPTIPQFDRVAGLAGALDNVAGGAFGTAVDALETVTSGLASSPVIQSAASYVGTFCAALDAGTTNVSAVLSTIGGHVSTLINYVTSDTTNYNTLQNQMTSASKFLGAVGNAKSTNPAIQTYVGKVMSPENIAALQSVGG